MSILVLSSRLTETRRAAFRALTRELGEPRFVGPGEALPEIGEAEAIVVDGPQPARPLAFLAGLRAAVERGVPLVAVGCAPTERDSFWADLLGAIAGPEPPPGEYYARVTEAHSHISARVTREFAVVDGFVPLIPLRDGKVIVDVSVALQDLAAVVESTHGAGRVVACGLGNTDTALRTPEVAQLLARALRPDLHCCGRKIGVAIVGYGPLGGMGTTTGSG
jgi:Trehalose utilisation